MNSCDCEITDRGLKDLSKGLKTLTSLQSINFTFERWKAFWIIILFTCEQVLQTHRSKPQIPSWESPKTKLLAIHHYQFYRVSDSSNYDFVYLWTAALNSQIKASKISVKVSEHSLLCNPSVSIFWGKWFCFLWSCWSANSCEKITDQGLKDLSEGLKPLSALQSINLWIARWDIFVKQIC